MLHSSSTLAETVGRYTAQSGNPRVRAVEARLRAPHSAAVVGRPGVGRRSVARALAAAGVTVVASGADVQILVVAEALKPEDVRLLAQGCPAVIVLNKADLSGRVVGGPLADATRNAAEIAARVGRPVVPMIALLATVDVDEGVVAALRSLAGTPADMTSTDAFVTSEHVLPGPVRRRLLQNFDRFGIAHAVLAVAEGAGAEELATRMRSLSQVDAVVEQLGCFGAEVRYRRAYWALSQLWRVAAETRDDELATFLVSDAVVLAVMACAESFMDASGVRIGRGDDLSSAVRWRRYADGPLDALHRRCAADVARGSLRLLGAQR